MPVQLSRDAAWDLLCEWTASDSLRRHMLAVEAAMRAYAPRFDGDVELWGLTGLLHDLDYERYPNLEDLEDGHPRSALRELEARGYPPELVRAVASHADFLGVSRDSPMEKTLVRGRRAVGVHLGRCLRAAREAPGHDAQVGEEEAQAAELRGRGQSRRATARRRGARGRLRRAPDDRDRSARGEAGRADAGRGRRRRGGLGRRRRGRIRPRRARLRRPRGAACTRRGSGPLRAARAAARTRSRAAPVPRRRSRSGSAPGARGGAACPAGPSGRTSR